MTSPVVQGGRTLGTQGCELGPSRKQGQQLPVVENRAACEPVRQSSKAAVNVTATAGRADIKPVNTNCAELKAVRVHT